MHEDLIARLEAATSPDRELDATIAEAIGLPIEWHIDFSDPAERRTPIRLTEWGGIPCAEFTASLDAALTLVADGVGIEIRRYWITRSIVDAIDVIDAGPASGCVWSAALVWGTTGEGADSEDRPNAALAVCIAALKARSAAHA